MTPDGRGATLAVAQAYSRGVARIAAAEAAMIRGLLADAPEAERPRLLDETLRTLLPAARSTIDDLHLTMLRDALVSTLSSPAGLRMSGSQSMTVALVDLCGSTAHLVAASVDDVERAVDVLFEAGESVTAGRAVQTVALATPSFGALGMSPRATPAASIRNQPSAVSLRFAAWTSPGGPTLWRSTETTLTLHDG